MLEVPSDLPGGRRELILFHAERLFAERGFHGATLSGIARASGLKNPGLIHYFPGKAQLYRAVLEAIATDLEQRLADALEHVNGAGPRLRALVEVQVAWIRERPVAVRLVQRELLDNPERLGSAHVLPLAGFVSTARSIVLDAQAEELVSPGPPEVKLNLLIGVLAYGAVVRPTFRQMLDVPLLDSEEAWMRAIADDLLGLLQGS